MADNLVARGMASPGANRGPTEGVEFSEPVVSDVGEGDLERPTGRRPPRALLRPALRAFAIACALLLTMTVLHSPTARSADPDTDMDGLTDAYEMTTLYTQRVTGSGLPKPIIDAGTQSASTALLPWQGIVNGAFADFTVDHPAKSELTVQVGYWNGTAWVDRYVWDPGSRLVGVSITQPVANQVLEGTVTVKASVPAADTIDHVDFYLGTSLLGTVTTPSALNTFSISFPALSFPFGSYQLKAVATDKLAAVSSATISVSVGDVANPSVSFAAPLAGSYVAGTYKVKVRATDGNGITSVRLRIDAGAYFSIFANFDGTYYWYNWATTSVVDGSHSLTAEATDGVGKVSTATVSVTVDNSGGGGGGGGGGCPPRCPVRPTGVAEPTPSASGTAYLGTTSIVTSSGYTQSGTVSTVVADLTKPRTQVIQVDRDNRILPPEFSTSLFHSQLTWRIVVRDWVPIPPPPPPPPGGCPPICPTRPTSLPVSSLSAAPETISTASVTQGSMTSFALRVEERTDPTKADTDGDTLTDGAEVKTYFTFPTTVDTDGDGARDDFEVVSHTITYSVNGVATTKSVKTSPTVSDTDADGLPDGEEYTLGADRVVTNPVLADTDGDTLTDGAEVLTHRSNPTLTDTDGDTIPDNVEVAARSLVLTINGGSVTRSVKTLPYSEDSDGDGLRDDKEFAGTSVYGVKTDPSDPDTDHDGLKDGQEKFVKEVSMTTRKTMGLSITVPLTVTLAGAIDRVDVRYGLSTISVSNFYVSLTKGSTTVVLRDRVGTGLYNYSSKDITTSFASHGGTYSLYVSSPVAGGVLEDYALSFVLRTSPVKSDSDGDGLNDSEEITYGKDAWITDPNRADTDGDTWSDSDEINIRGTNPLSVDTDQDGAFDNVDLDPLRNLLVAVKVKKIHHGASPWCTPELLGIVRVNDDYTWVTEHRLATEDRYYSLGCLSDISSTSVFGLTYYSDVPDAVSAVPLRMTAWSINPGRGDDILVDTSVSYTLNSGTKSLNVTNGNSWYSFDVWTQALPKANTLLITDGNATVTASNGQRRLSSQDRYFVFSLNVTSAYAPFAVGLNSIVISRSIFLDSKLKKDFDAGSYWPVADASMYGQDLGKTDISEGVAGVIAKTVPGSDAYNLLDRLRRNKTNSLTYDYADISGYPLLANLPADVVKIIPWTGVSNGATGTLPSDFWQKIGAVASTVINSLVYIGEMIYKGLIALGTFLANLAQAIWEWGMKILGALKDAVADAANKVADALKQLASWIVGFIQSLIDVAFKPLIDAFNSWRTGVASNAAKAVSITRSGSAEITGAPPPGGSMTTQGMNSDASPLRVPVSEFVESVLVIESLMVVAVAVLAIIEIASKPFNWYAKPLADFVGKYLMKIIVATILATVLATAFDVFVGDPLTLLPSPLPSVSGWIFNLTDLAVTLEMHRKLRPDWSFLSEFGRTGPVVTGTLSGLVNILKGLLLITVAAVVPAAAQALGFNANGAIANGALILLDVAGLYYALHGLNLVRMDKVVANVLVITHAVSEILGVIGFTSAIASFASDLIKFKAAADSGTL